MSQSDMVIADQPGAAFLSDLNSVIAALATNSSGATEPATTYAFQPWADTTSGIFKLRNAANNAWVNLWDLATGLPMSANNAVLNAAQVFTAQQTPAGAAATAGAGATYNWAVAAAQVLELTFGAGNITTFSASGMVAKTCYLLQLKQDSVGGRTWATTGIKWPGGVAPTLSTAANAVDIFIFYFDGTSLNCIGQNLGEA